MLAISSNRRSRASASAGNVMPKAVPGGNEPLALSAVGSSKPTLAKFKADSDRQRWLLRTP